MAFLRFVDRQPMVRAAVMVGAVTAGGDPYYQVHALVRGTVCGAHGGLATSCRGEGIAAVTA